MRIVIAGGGRIGSQLARKLVDEGHLVTVIDRSRETCEAIFQEVGAATVCGEATDVRVLEQAAIATADVAVGLLSRDADNLSFALLVRSFSNARTMARVFDKAFVEAYRLAGIRDVIAEAEVVVGRITTSIDFPQVQGTLPIGRGEALLFEIAIPRRGTVVGLTVAEVQRAGRLPRDCILVCLIRADGTVDLPSGATVLEAGDLALVVARREQIGAAIRSLTEEPPAPTRGDPVADALQAIELFHGLTQEQLAEIVYATRQVSYPEDALLFVAGEPADRLFVVLEGEVHLVDAEGGITARVAQGEAFGDAELLLGNPRALTARAGTDVRVAYLRRDSLRQVVDANPDLAVAMSRSLGGRETPSASQDRPGWSTLARLLPWRRDGE